jgi:hypothetical protein
MVLSWDLISRHCEVQQLQLVVQAAVRAAAVVKCCTSVFTERLSLQYPDLLFEVVPRGVNIPFCLERTPFSYTLNNLPSSLAVL